MTVDPVRPVSRGLDGLFDLELLAGPDGSLRAVRDPDAPLDAAGLADLVRRTGGAGDDVRIVMADGGRHEPVFAELAGLLGRDVLITPAGTVPGHLDGEDVYIDAANGRPACWQVVQPPAMATALPGWYATGTVVRPRTGTVTVPLPGGLMIATRADFVARRAAAATLRPGHPNLTTIGVPVRAGGFVIGEYGGGHEVADGCRLAAALAAVPLYGTEVRMWISWPADPDGQDRLHDNLRDFAEITGATLWAPEPDAVVKVVEGAHDLAVMSRDGRRAEWIAWVPPGGGAPLFVSGPDGRLRPAEKPEPVVVDAPPAVAGAAPAGDPVPSSSLPPEPEPVPAAPAVGPVVSDKPILLPPPPVGLRPVRGRPNVPRVTPAAPAMPPAPAAPAVTPPPAPVVARAVPAVPVAPAPPAAPVAPPAAPAPVVPRAAPAPPSAPVVQRPAAATPSAPVVPRAVPATPPAPVVPRAAPATPPAPVVPRVVPTNRPAPAAPRVVPATPPAPVVPRPAAATPPAPVVPAAAPAEPVETRAAPTGPPVVPRPRSAVSRKLIARRVVPIDPRAVPGSPPAAPTSNRPTPVEQRSGAVEWRSGPVEQRSAPVEWRSGPVEQRSAPVEQRSGAVEQRSGPVEKKFVPLGQGSAPAGKAPVEKKPARVQPIPLDPPQAQQPVTTPVPVKAAPSSPRNGRSPMVVRDVVRPVEADGGAQGAPVAPPPVTPLPALRSGAGPDSPSQASNTGLFHAPPATNGVKARPRSGDDPHVGPAGRLPVGTAPELTTRSRIRHGLYWLSDRPQVNAGPVDLYVTCTGDPARAADDGVQTPHLFVIGMLHPPASGTLHRDENLLRVRVDEGGAVDLTSIDVHVPPSMSMLHDCPDDSYLLPGGLLDRVRLLDGWRAHPSGGYEKSERFAADRPLTLRSTGAMHKVEGLPADVLRWPTEGADIAYTLLPGPVLAATGALALLATRPRPRPGHRLLELEVPAQQVLDVRAAAQQLAGMPAVRSTAPGLVARGIDLILPAKEQREIRVRRVLTPGRIGWKPEPGSGGVDLPAFLATESH